MAGPADDATPTTSVGHWWSLKPRHVLAPFKVVIPTFDRPHELCRQTLVMLQDQCIPLENICIFVAPGTRDQAHGTRP